MSDREMVPPPIAPQPAQTSRFAIASLVVSLLFFVPLVAPVVAIVLGIVALNRISRSRGALGGKGFAIGGIAISGGFLVLSCFVASMASMLLPALSTAREQALAAACRMNLTQVGYAVAMYQTDFDRQMPPDLETLCVRGYLKIGINREQVGRSRLLPGTVLTCPLSGEPVDSADIDGTSSYYYARDKDAERMVRPYQLPIAWEKKTYHFDSVNVLYADLHVELMTMDALRQRTTQYAQCYEKPPQMPAVIEREKTWPWAER